MAINDTTFELTRTSGLRSYKEEQSIHYDLDAEFLAVVDVDPTTVSELDVQFASGCPKPYFTNASTAGVPGAYSNWLLCTDVSVERFPQRNDHFTVKCKFTTNYRQDTDPEDETADPDDPTTWTTLARIQRYREKTLLNMKGLDLDAKVYANSAGQRFSNVPEIDENILSMSAYIFKPANTSTEDIEAMDNKINDADWNGCAADTILTNIIEDEFGSFGSPIVVRRLRVDFKYKKSTWLEKVSDFGSAYLTNPAGPVGDPNNWTFFANGEDGALSDGSPSPGAPDELVFRFYERANFSSLFKVKFAIG